MSIAYQIVVCAGIVPDPLQTLEPVVSPTGLALKNEMMPPPSSIRGRVTRFNNQIAAFAVCG